MSRQLQRLAAKFVKQAQWASDKSVKDALTDLWTAIMAWQEQYGPRVAPPKLDRGIPAPMSDITSQLRGYTELSSFSRAQLNALYQLAYQVGNVDQLGALGKAGTASMHAWLETVNTAAIKLMDAIKNYVPDRPTATPAASMPSVDVKDLPSAAPAAPTSPAKKTIDPHNQFKLNELGFTDNQGEKLKLDGIWGAKTHEALTKFKIVSGMPNASDEEALGHLQKVYEMKTNGDAVPKI